MKSEVKLVLNFYADDDETGKLCADVSANGFSGVGGAWFNQSDLLKFAQGLAAYPLPKDNLPQIAGGFWQKDSKGGLKQEHLAISVYPIDSLGHLGIQVRLATEIYEGMRPESQHLVKLEIKTSYNALAKFSQAIIALIHGQIEKAVLDNA